MISVALAETLLAAALTFTKPFLLSQPSQLFAERGDVAGPRRAAAL